MKSEYLFTLTLGVYRVTQLFQKQEPLKFKLRDRALDVLTDLISASPNPGIKKIEEVAPALNKNIEVIMDFLDLAESQNLADSRNFLVLRREYNKISEYIKERLKEKSQDSFCAPTLKKESVSAQRGKVVLANINLRQKKIIDVLKGNGDAQPGEILKFFNGLSKRTLRRDLGVLVKMGMVERVGKCNQTFYKFGQEVGTDSMS